MSLQERFDEAAVNAKKLKNASNSELLELYGLYKQGTGADFSAVTKPKPGWIKSMDEATLKYEAWEKVKDVSVEDAQEQYIKLVAELGEKYGFKE
ncbi:acyl-CoA binding protein [Talaromyces pinophilus]|uniref:Acyl-CoA binding protein n=1 Tax=Talaromyces pinophilus TaxID=128442 RepID=A0A6V8H7G5_TALPI|nr:acyl-CoA binding protein [Talaromyces pinophilus]